LHRCCFRTAFWTGYDTFHNRFTHVAIADVTSGEALSLDLGDFIQGLYGLLLPLGLDPNIETIPQSASKTQARSTAELLFRALELGLNNRSYRGSGSSSSSKLNAGSGSAPAGRCAAFSRRLLGCALAWPGTSAARAVHFVRGLIARDRRLLVLLDADEAATDGVWRPEIEDPDLANALAGPAWEVRVLGEKHVDERVRAAVAQLLEVVKEG
jgi:nucleolar complex protein 3